MRILFGLVVVPCFGILSVGLAIDRASPRQSHAAKLPPDIVAFGVILFLALIAAYGLDQLLTGMWPTRSRWFTRVEVELDERIGKTRGRGNLTVAHVWGAPIRAHWSVLVGLVLVGGLQLGAWLGFLAVILAHELGHAVLVRRFGQHVVALSLHALGGECHWIGRPAPRQRTVIAWGGVAGQMMLLGVAWGVGRALPWIFTGTFGDPLGRALTHSNIVMAGFNLLPIPPLDGVEAWSPLLRRLQRRPRAPASERVDKLVKSVLTTSRKDR